MKQTFSNSEREQPSHCLEQEQTSCGSEVQQTSSDMDATSRVPRVPCHCAAPVRPKQYTCETCQLSVCKRCLISYHLDCDQNASSDSNEQEKVKVYSNADKKTYEFTKMIGMLKFAATRIDNKVSKVKIMIRNLDTYKDELLNYRGQLTEMLERYRYNLLQVSNQKKKLSKSLNNSNKYVEVDSLLETLEHLNIPAEPKNNLENIVDVYDDVRNDPDFRSFNRSFCQLLRAETKSREVFSSESVEDSDTDPLEHDALWYVSSSTIADQAIELLSGTATKPRDVTISIDEIWTNFIPLLTALASHKSLVDLDFYNMTVLPNETCSDFIRDVLRHMRDTTPRYELRSFTGKLNIVTAKLLMEIAPERTIDLMLIIQGADEMEALRYLTSSGYANITLHICSHTEPGCLSALPLLCNQPVHTTSVSSYSQLTIFGVTDNKLPWLVEVLTKLDCRGEHVRLIMLSESRLTEWGLKELLEFLEQAGVSNKTINVVTEALDQEAMNRTIQSYQERICSVINIKSSLWQRALNLDSG